MLNKVRKPTTAKGMIAAILFGAICLVFVFMGVTPGDPSMKTGGAPAIVNSKTISIQDVRESLENMRRRMQIDLNQFPAAQREMFEANMRRRALESLIVREVVAQSAAGYGYVVPNIQLADMIREQKVFQEDGRFQTELYEAYLNYYRKSAKDFEEQLRKDILLRELQGLFAFGLAPVKGEAELGIQLAKTKLNIDVVKFSQEELEEAIPVTSQEVADFLKSKEGAAKAESYYNTNKPDFEIKEKVRARHILIMADPNSSEAQREAAKTIAQIQNDLKSKKKTFAELAMKHSQDTVSAKKGGDLGYFEKGKMTPAFEKAAFSMKVGEISEPVKTPFGVHIIKVEDKQAGSMKPYDGEKKAIARKLISQEKVGSILTSANGALEKGSVSEIERWMKKMKFKWEATGEFDLSQTQVPVIGADEKILEGAFKLSETNPVPKEILKSQGEYYILKFRSLKFAKVSEGETVDNSANYQRSGEVFNQWIDEQKSKASIKRSAAFLNPRAS